MSTQWTPIGSSPCPYAILTVTPSTQSPEVGTTATVSATFTNSCGTPLAGANVDLTGLTGPNAGAIHMDTTDRSGNASFNYTSASSGTDALQAEVTNLAGTITSSDVSVTWTNTTSAPAAAVVVQGKSAPAASASRGGGGGGSSGGGGSGGGGCSLQPGHRVSSRLPGHVGQPGSTSRAAPAPARLVLASTALNIVGETCFYTSGSLSYLATLERYP